MTENPFFQNDSNLAKITETQLEIDTIKQQRDGLKKEVEETLKLIRILDEIIADKEAKIKELRTAFQAQPEKKLDSGLRPSLDDLIGSDQVESLLQSPPDPDYRGGRYATTATIHKASKHLFDLPNWDSIRNIPAQAKARFVSTHLLVKTANRETGRGIISFEEAIKRDAYVSRLPGIYPFSALVSDIHYTSDGRPQVVVEQMWRGYKIEEDQLKSEDYYRIIFQLLMMGEEYHRHGFTRLDFGKSTDVYYQTEEVGEGEANPRRILTYDFTYWETFDEQDRQAQMKYDFELFVNNINNGCRKYFSSDLLVVWDRLQLEILNGTFASFGQIAEVIAQTAKDTLGVDVAAEYQTILSQTEQ